MLREGLPGFGFAQAGLGQAAESETEDEGDEQVSNNESFGCLAAALVALIVVAIVWFVTAQESATYNRLTGARTTTWDALWVELRVQDTPKESK